MNVTQACVTHLPVFSRMSSLFSIALSLHLSGLFDCAISDPKRLAVRSGIFIIPIAIKDWTWD